MLLANRIKPYIHSCIIQAGDMVGNTHKHEVADYEYEYKVSCTYCQEPLVTTEALLAHIYGELTDE